VERMWLLSNEESVVRIGTFDRHCSGDNDGRLLKEHLLSPCRLNRPEDIPPSIVKFGVGNNESTQLSKEDETGYLRRCVIVVRR